MQIGLILLYKFLLTVAVFSLSCVQFFYDPMDCSLLGASVHEIFQVRILEWVAIFCCRVSPQPKDQTSVPVSSGLQADSLPLSHKGSPANSGLN